MATGVVVPGTIIDRVVKMGEFPVEAAYTNVSYKGDEVGQDGLGDSLKYLLMQKAWQFYQTLATITFTDYS